MREIERQEEILNILKESRTVSVNKLVKVLNASPATIRRDLTDMESKGLIKRIHGGAILFVSSNAETSILLREEENKKEKKAICERCVDFIKNNQSIFLDSSSTVVNLIPFLNNFQYLVLATNGLNAALKIGNLTKFTAYVPNGFVKTQSNSITGETVCQTLEKIKCDLLIFSCAGVSIANGITEPSIEVSEIKALMMKNTTTRILLVDSSKFDKTYFSKTADLSAIDIIITNEKPSEEYIKFFQDNNVKLVIAH